MRPDIVPIAIGISLCSASALLLYIWYKTKDREDDDLNSPVKSSSKSSKITKVDCIVPNNVVPLVVGRGGANVKSIEGKTNTQIRFRVKDDNSQICEISGKLEDVKKAAELINIQASPPPNLTEEMLVPQTAYGKIVGRCGEALQEICRKSQAKVHIDAGDRGEGDMRRLCITGTRAHVNMAKKLIEEKIRIDKESRDNLEVKREPRGNVKPVVESATAAVATAADDKSDVVLQPTREKLPTSIIEGQLEVYVSAVASPSRFWVQLFGKQSSQLDNLTTSMTEYYEKADNQNLHKIADPYLGQIVAAMFKYDSKWYRAEIVGILPNDYNPRDVILDLYFVDFGDSEYVHPKEVFELRTDFLTLRFQAIECFLAKVKPKNNAELWEQDAISRFEDLTHVARWEKMTARVVTTKERKYGDAIKREGSPIPGLEIFNVDTPDINIADQLISEGYADIITSNSGHSRSTEDVLRLDGGSDSNTKKVEKNHRDESDKFAEIVKPINGNHEPVPKSNLKNSSSSFIDTEKQNGNKVTSAKDMGTVDRNSNRSHIVT
ncbi:tudor and KH domain-containing protein homolog [Bradysia coprophila]|uniref:tudor and KH domain-containing protein homolog n=1 Tax=Bradysia coprophila TaxID=38358 RepID=UPI00187DD95B|nr:tudor and KH domain-containing protein homolog [Bradysia coprophila]XP_037040145.1 tudor and KH domain-containing protein homolog [Bradysia coprophila]